MGYAARVEARAAEPLLVHNGDFLFQLRGADRGNLARRSSTDNNNIKVFRHLPSSVTNIHGDALYAEINSFAVATARLASGEKPSAPIWSA
jgi:hypothetical protein